MKRAFMFVKERPGVFGIAALTLLLLVAGLLTPQKTTAAFGLGPESATTFSNFDCQFDTNTLGQLQDTTIYLRDSGGGGITLDSVDQSGKRTWVSLPTVFRHGSGTTPKTDLPLPNGSFKVVMKVKLAGNKSVVWLSKRNVVKLEVHVDSVSGPIVAQATLDRSSSSPTTYTLTTNFYSANQPHDTFRTYYIMIRFDKYDGNGSNDGQCGMEIKVRSI
jgi:hypothetical protein